MNSSDQHDRALRESKKIMLQNRLRGKGKRSALAKLIKRNATFLELEASLAIWAEIERKHLWHPTPYNGYVQIDVKDDCESYVGIMETVLAEVGELGGFCFTPDWKSTGVVIMDSIDLGTDLNSILRSNDDEVSFFSAGLEKAILFVGERTGSGDKLYELSVSVLGDDWVRRWKDATEA